MTIEEALKVYKTKTTLAKALGLSKSTVSGWGNEIPLFHALRLEKLTEGRLKANYPLSA